MRRTACFPPGSWGGVVVGKRLPPLQSHAFEWVRDWVRVITALHHTIDKVEEPSLVGILHHHSDRPHQSSTHRFPCCFLVSSQSTITLRLLPPYAPQNETSIFVASYGSYHVQFRDPGFPRHRDQDTLQSKDEDSTVQTMLPLNEISLNCSASCNGCNGYSDEFSGYTRFGN